jgi:hypothetical protein
MTRKSYLCGLGCFSANLDLSLILHRPIYEAGMYLARKGRQEYQINVAGIRQYSIPYPHFWEQANEMDRVFANSQAKPVDLTISSLPEGGEEMTTSWNEKGNNVSGGFRETSLDLSTC